MERVLTVQPLANFMLELTFSDGSSKIVDIRPFIGDGLSMALQDQAYFQKVKVESGGGIFWPNGFDFCPNFLHDEVPAVQLIDA
jgi:hypothetical protein